MYKATVKVTLRSSILDPAGKASHQALQNLGLTDIQKVRIGKLIELDVTAASPQKARAKAQQACKQLLANEVMEDFTVDVHEIAEQESQ